MSRRVRWCGASVLALAISMALPALLGTADARPPAPHNTLKQFRLTGKYGYFQDGRCLKGAHLYYSKSAFAYLITDVGRKDALLIRTRDRSYLVEAVPAGDLITNDDGSRDLKRSARIKTVGKFFLQGKEIRLQGEGLNGALRTKPHLIGWKTARDLLEHKPEYGYAAVLTKANKDKIKALKAYKGKPVVVKMFFGSWCTECDKQIPRAIFLDQALSGVPNIKFQYYGIPEGTKAMHADAEVKKATITKLPTGVVYVDGREANRIVQGDWATPAWALDAILTTAAMTSNAHQPK